MQKYCAAKKPFFIFKRILIHFVRHVLELYTQKVQEETGH